MHTDVSADLEQEKSKLGWRTDLPQRVRAALSSIRPIGAFQVIMALSVLLSLVCLVVTPPWWHYDEPGHFEYAWLAAHSPTWPVKGQYNQAMRKELGASLLQYGWYQIRNLEPDLTGSKKIPIGITQVGDKPVYYLLASLPLRLMPNAPILVQYYAARLVSLLLYLLIVLVVWHALGEILPGDHVLRWMASIFTALLPAFVDTMAAVNNDVTAVLATSLFLWASLKLIQKGFSIRRLLFLAASLVACYLSKSTALFTFALAPLVLILALARNRAMAGIWGGIAVMVIAAAFLILQWGNPLGWYQESPGALSLRVQMKGATLGSYAFQFDDSGTGRATGMTQVMLLDEIKPLRGQTVTLGAWVWAEQPTWASPVFIKFFTDSGKVIVSPHQPMKVGTQPTFWAVSFSIPQEATRAWVQVSHGRHGLPDNNVFYDGLVLSPGDFRGAIPDFTGANAAGGSWRGQLFTNLLRNGSAEQGSLEIRRGSIHNRVLAIGNMAHMNVDFMLMALQDWRGTALYFRSVAAVLLRSFWASMAGDKAPLRSTAVNNFLQVLTLAGVAGVPVWLWKRRGNLRWDLIGFLGIALLVPWVLASVRGASSLSQKIVLYPWARYAYPGILPTALLLCTGWLAWLEILSGRLKLSLETTKGIFLSLMLGITVFAVMNAIQVLHRQWWDGWISLLLLFLFQYAIFRWIIGRQIPKEMVPPSDGTGAA